MNTILSYLKADASVSDYKYNEHKRESCELFFVKGKLETVRRTATCDKQVTVYVDHDGFKGESSFLVYPSTTEGELQEKITDAVAKAKLINNADYALPEKETGSFEVASNFADYELSALSEKIADCVFAANTLENADLNSVEVFVTRHTETVVNSRGIHKTQVRYSAMVEAIPTFNGETESVELYQQYNFASMDEATIQNEIAAKLREVKARAQAKKPEGELAGKVILNKLELSELFGNIAYNLDYSAVYAHASVFQKGDAIQKDATGDKFTITMSGEVEGNLQSNKFDSDGLTLGSIAIVEDGVATNYYGNNRFGQYLKEVPTGRLGCMTVAPGSVSAEELAAGPALEVVSMSGLQVDFYTDYIGGEVRLAYWNDGETVTPVTGISITGKLSQVLSSLRLSETIATHDGYVGPEKAILSDMQIF